MKIVVLLVIAVAFVAYACCGRRRPPITVDLGGIAEVQLREDLRLDARDTEQNGDRATFRFRRVNDTHLNGQTSYAEQLTLSLLAPDLPAADSLDVQQSVYERHPVKQDAWRIRMTDAKTGIELDWTGYRKHYSRPQAEAHLRAIAGSLRWKQDRATHFAQHRDWSGADWPAVFRHNMATLNHALAAQRMPPVSTGQWTSHRQWLYAVDEERPQRFHLVRHIAGIAMADGPFRLAAPLTFFRYFRSRGFWHQENQGHGGGKLPDSLLPGFRSGLSNPEHVYFYRMQSLQLWQEHPSLPTALQELMRDGDAQAREFATRGALEPDSEP
ncbi:MAG: hypothetical protein JNK48_21235 [Bryobacterales bacterium]|nr:hypothetical protein [Bryobacterales bacterium]